ncbi:hypothetical protein FKM82_029057 [Ascaphus truei]
MFHCPTLPCFQLSGYFLLDAKKVKIGEVGPVETIDSKEQTRPEKKGGDDEEEDDEPSLPMGLTGAFEDTAFSSLADSVNESTRRAISEMGFTHMTEIQHKSIRPLLEGR